MAKQCGVNPVEMKDVIPASQDFVIQQETRLIILNGNIPGVLAAQSWNCGQRVFGCVQHYHLTIREEAQVPETSSFVKP